jgi:hypothetical protein
LWGSFQWLLSFCSFACPLLLLVMTMVKL